MCSKMNAETEVFRYIAGGTVGDDDVVDSNSYPAPRNFTQSENLYLIQPRHRSGNKPTMHPILMNS